MGIDRKRVYRKRNPFIVALKAIGVLVGALILLFIILFFSLQKYIVYTPSGVKLDIPYWEQYRK